MGIHKITYDTLKRFEAFIGHQLTMDNFDKAVFGIFVQYLLLKRGMGDYTINRCVRFLKAFIHWAFPDMDVSWMKYTILKCDPEVIALTESELRYLANYENQGSLEKIRDLFCFLATSGMRFSDSQLFDPSWVSKEQIMEFSQRRTGGKAYAPLSHLSQRILTKYGGVPPRISKNKLNDYLKILFKKVGLSRLVVIQLIKGRKVINKVRPLHEVISSHTARRTFISICLEKGMPIKDIMKMSGYADYKSMKPYIRVTRQHLRKVADK